MEGIGSYDLLVPKRIVFGWGQRALLPALASVMGQRVFLVTGGGSLEASGELARLRSGLAQSGIRVVELPRVRQEPLVADVDQAMSKLRQHHPGPGDIVIAMGGGSAVDLGKAVAGLALEGPGSTMDYLEGVGSGRVIAGPTLPFVAVPTTAGTGSEATKNAVIASKSPPFKKSLRSDRMLAELAVVDPELTVPVPPDITARTGMDAITQLIESAVSSRARPIPKAIALSALPGIHDALRAAFRDPADRPARERLAHAALCSGIALANSGLGMAHGVAAALGMHCDIAHGLACAIMLPASIEANRAVAAEAYAQVARALRGKRFSSADDETRNLVDLMDELLGDLKLPRRLGQVGVRRGQIPALVRDSKGNSMAGNPRPITDSELAEILEHML